MDTSQYLSMFLEESSDNLQVLNESLLSLENDSEDSEMLNQIFRVAHTIKGMAATMGYSKMAELTHKMEDVLSEFREGELKVTHGVITVLFKCLDTLEAMVSDITDGGDGDIDVEEIMTQLISIAENHSPSAEEAEKTTSMEKENISSQKINTNDLGLNEYDLDTLREAKKNGYNVFHVHIKLDEKTILKSARVFILFQTLENQGEILKSNPKLEDLESENFDFDIDLIFVTESNVSTIEKDINNISEIRDVLVEEISHLLGNVAVNHNNTSKEVAATKIEEKKEKLESKEIVNKNSKENKEVKKAEAKGSEKKVDNKKNSAKTRSKGVGQSVRVDLDKLDNFMNMVSELVIHRTRLEQISGNYRIQELNETLEQVARTTTDLQDLVMKIRMLPLDVVFNRFPRMIRDLSMELHKEIDFEVQGQDTELDRTVIEEIGEPLIHLLRNAADHGIESAEERIAAGKSPAGKVKLTAYSEGTKAVIKVEDDGHGLDVEKIRIKAEKKGINTEGMSDNDIKNLIFAQGFSTNEVVTDISGRGVGMDVVKTKISSLGGTVDVVSEVGKGSTFTIKLPLTLQIIQALLVKIGTETMAISLAFIDRVMEYNQDNIKKTNNKEVLTYNDKVFQLVRINGKLDIESVDYGKKYIILAKVGEKEIALVVDSLLGQKEIVIKTFGKILKSTKEYIGATILGDGLVTLILDVPALI